ncbi:hypothetical protein RvY_12247 [Ramazzottius varieornatus]|uniref:Uncharacterized protein n=1 Tax=Ramazzottius varieornatus TaxID=947166 RepID=A0A1D1VKU9_RAMVA|nr:hypothetical protein RvY_12247 [Ramazzottius varieornatus]
MGVGIWASSRQTIKGTEVPPVITGETTEGHQVIMVGSKDMDSTLEAVKPASQTG